MEDVPAAAPALPTGPSFALAATVFSMLERGLPRGEIAAPGQQRTSQWQNRRQLGQEGSYGLERAVAAQTEAGRGANYQPAPVVHALLTSSSHVLVVDHIDLPAGRVFEARVSLGSVSEGQEARGGQVDPPRDPERKFRNGL